MATGQRGTESWNLLRMASRMLERGFMTIGLQAEDEFCWAMSASIGDQIAAEGNEPSGSFSRIGLPQACAIPPFTLIVCDNDDDQRLEATLTAITSCHSGVVQIIVTAEESRRPAIEALRDRQGGPATFEIVAPHGQPARLSAETAAIDCAIGAFAGFLNAGDRIEPDALAILAKVLDDHPPTTIIYSDEDWMDSRQRRFWPRLKSAWDPDAQLSRDLLGRLCLLRLDGVRAVGGLRPELAPAHLYDLNCRVAFAASPVSIRHVPHVLCHRWAPVRHALELQAPSPDICSAYTAAAREVARLAAEAVCAQTIRISSAPMAPLINRIHWPLPREQPLVSVLIPTRDRADLLRNCLSGLLNRTRYSPIEVLVLDNDSALPETFQLFAELAADPRVRIVAAPGPFNFSRINNLGAAQARGEILLLLNNDIEVIESGWLDDMVANALRPDVGAVGARLLYGDRRVQHAGVVLQHQLAMHVFRTRGEHDPGYDWQMAGTRTYSAVTAACLAVRRSVFEQVGGFDEDKLRVAFQDVDLCLKIDECGYRNVCTPYVPLLHLEGASRGLGTDPEKIAREHREFRCLRHRWSDRFARDPYSHPQVVLDWERPERLVPFQMDVSTLDLVR